MSLIDRFAPNAHTESSGNGYVGISGGAFADWLQFLATGLVTKAQLISRFELTEEPAPDADETQLNQMISHYQGLSTDIEKVNYVLNVQGAIRQRRQEELTQSEAMAIMQIT